MKDFHLSTKKRLIIFSSISLVSWGIFAWLSVTMPIFVIELLPDPIPLSIFTFAIFLIGLLFLAIVGTTIVRSVAPRHTWMVVFTAAFLIVAYNLSPLAPGWKCFGNRLYIRFANAAGQNCTETCTNNDSKPCSGYSSCWDKNVSCSSDGRDQDGRGCNGCCFSCDVVCEEEDPDYNRPMIVAASINCSQVGTNGWCVGSDTLTISASDPQGFALTISGKIGSIPFTCPKGNMCSKALPEGSGTITYKVTAGTSGLSSGTGSKNWKRDVSEPTADIAIPPATGSNSWFNTLPVDISINGFDDTSGLAIARLSLDHGTTWQASSLTLSTEGQYIAWYGAVDNAGNTANYSGRNVNIDTTPPTLTPSASGTMGASEWYVSNVVVDASATDNLSGILSVVVSDNGGAAKPVPVTLTSGNHALTITATDVAGNSRSTTLNLTIDTDGPIITPSITGTEGSNNWYVSDVDVMATTSDPISGLDGTLEVSVDGGAWTTALPIHFTEGEHIVELRAYDEAGNESTKKLTINVDTTPPVLSTATSGTAGNSGWFVSDATTTISARDSTSDIDYVEYRQNNAVWKNGTSVLSGDGINTLTARAYDLAGNSATKSLEIKVDTVPPMVMPLIPTPTGLDDWFVSVPVVISANGTDVTSGLLSALVSTDKKTWEDNLSLSDGLYTATFRSEDVSGNTTSIPLDLKIDATKPTLEISTSGTVGTNGWYTGQTITTFKAGDRTSGIDRVEYSQNNSTWQIGTSVVSKHGFNYIAVKTYDKAGNMHTSQADVKVDTGMPTSAFTSPVNGSTDTLARSILPLSGTTSDDLSGIASVEISYDGGKTWVLTTLSTDGKWAYEFDTTKVPDGIYTIIVRTTDLAGNTVVSTDKSGAHIAVVINNAPPHIKLTPEWLIWDSGELVIKTEYFPLKNGTVTISDPQRRWPKVEIPFGEKYPSTIAWDRRFANGVPAPVGNYQVDVDACNTYNLCSRKSATIKIPWISVILPTVSPAAPTTVPTNSVVENLPEQSETQAPSVVVAQDSPPQEQNPASIQRRPVGTALSLAALIALMWAVASAALSDRRPLAINAITKTILQKRNI